MPYRLHLRCGFGETDQDVDEALANLKLLSKLMKHGQVDLGPLIYYKGTEIERQVKDWPITNHPAYDVACPMMANIPQAWANFASEAARMRLMHKRGLKGFDKEWVTRYRACVDGWCEVL